jgi:hypothetical protein
MAAMGVAAAGPRPDTVVAAAELAPDATELLFWQSAERLATPAAYRAYLSRYPAGFFASLAFAAIAKATPAPDARANDATNSRASVTGESQSKLTQFSEEPDTGAVSFRLGEELVGPRALTVGSLGAKKQLVIPAGRWIVLAARDDATYMPSSYATQGPTRVRLTTVAFGKFVGSRLASVLRFNFSSQKVASTVSWSRVEGCESDGEFKLRSYRPAASSYRSECRALAFESKPLADESVATAEIRSSLSRLGATLDGAALVSSITFTEARRGYLGVVRLDWPGVWLGDDLQPARAWRPENLDAAREAFVGQLWAWSQTYRDAASVGYGNDFSDDDKGLRDFAPVAAPTAAK